MSFVTGDTFLCMFHSGGYGEAVNTADCGSVTRGFDPHYSPHLGASPSGKAMDFDSIMRWFDPSRPCHCMTH